MKILTYPNEVLQTKCSDICTSDPESTLAALEEALTGQNGEHIGCGLAANQIGIPHRICIIRYENYRMDLINPRIVHQSSDTTFEEEGCLSLPDKFYKIRRPKFIVYEADNEHGSVRVGNEMLARIIQHEIDHLDGKGIWSYYKIGRNGPCPCGSGKKYKKCCLGM